MQCAPSFTYVLSGENNGFRTAIDQYLYHCQGPEVHKTWAKHNLLSRSTLAPMSSTNSGTARPKSRRGPISCAECRSVRLLMKQG